MPLDPIKIKSRREQLGITQAEAARRAGMPRPHWTRIEMGDRNDPALSTAEKVAAALSCSILKLIA